MCWKKISYWIKGGVIGLVIGILLLIGFIGMSCSNSSEAECNSKLLLSNTIDVIISIIFIPLFLGVSPSHGWIFYGGIIICSFVWGAIIGFIFGKIKSRKKKK